MPDNNIEWGQGGVNNSNDWGKAKANSTNSFGAVYDSSPSGDTNIAGGQPVVSITYSASAFCADASDPTPTIQNNAGAGAFSSTTGLVINSTTGVIDLDASTASTYTVTYTDTDAATAIFDLTIHALPTVTVSVSAGTICNGESTILTASGASTYVWNDSNTDNPRTVSPTTTTTYTATGTDSNGCTNTGATTITVNAQDSAAFSYAASTYCANGTDPTPTITGTSGGAFTSTTGLVINSGTGAIDLDASTVGAYSITYTTTGVCPANQSTNITINAADNAAFSYSASSYAPTDSDPTPTITGLTGGTFSGTTGLVIDSSTGVIDLSASTVAAHTITYNTSSSGSSVCPNTSTQSVEIAVAGIANNYSMNFDAASSDYLQVANTTDFDFGTGDFAWSLWINYETHVNYAGLLYTGATNSEYRLKFQTSGQILYMQNADGDSQVADLGTNITGTGWHHLCLVRSSGTITTYLDGSAVDTDSRTGNVNSNGDDLLIGRNGSSYFDGQIDEVAVWNTALTSTQVSEIYNGTGTNLTKDLTTVSGSNLKYWNRMGD
jgi:hypothetical protein